MAKVIVLPDHVASQIAAGEVVERPASVVKEFVENSIDAGANHIEIAVSADCRDIRVADDGAGMAADDAVLAFQRHATSKITCADDLWRLRTLGFRGEALPSIASVSQLVCFTRARNAPHGNKIDTAGAKIAASETGCAPGTIMELTDLFYNVPARLSFLKRPATEFAHIQEIVQALAIAHPHVAFTLKKQNDVVLKSTGSGALLEAIVEAGFFADGNELIEVGKTDERSGIGLHGYIGSPLKFRGDRKGILTYINNRVVRCPLTYKALDQAYGDLIPSGKYPLAVLHISIDPAQVDINIHPTKKEVRYSNGNDIYLFLQRSLTSTLYEQSKLRGLRTLPQLVPTAEKVADSFAVSASGTAGAPVAFSTTGIVGEPVAFLETGIAADSFMSAAAGKALRLMENTTNVNGESRTDPLSKLGSTEPLNYFSAAVAASAQSIQLAIAEAVPHESPAALPPNWRLAGYIHNTYILLETGAGLEIIEQHIAHERVLYERLLEKQSAYARGLRGAQTLLISAELHLTPLQEAVLKENLPKFFDLGFDFDIKENAAEPILCKQVPQELSAKNYATAIQAILDAVCVSETADFLVEAAKSIACQSAVKNGMPLDPTQLRQLLQDWHVCPRHDTCPHGRPIRLKYSKDELFTLFHP